jgi:hypothetical protein
MAFFEQVGSSPLYVATGDDPGWLAFVLPGNATPPYPPAIELNQALTDSALSGSFVFASRAPGESDPSKLAREINAVLWPLPASRYMVWLRDPDSIAATCMATMGMTADGSAVSGGLVAPLVQHEGSIALALQVPNTATLTQTPPATGTDLTLAMSNGGATISFTGTAAPQPNQTQQITSATLHLAGPHRGCFDFATVLQRQFLHDDFSWGLQFVIPSNGRAVAEWLPLAHGDLPSPTDMIAFGALIDPADPLNASQAGPGVLPTRTALTFENGATLCSYYSTTAGAGVTLVPVPGPLDTTPTAARLVFTTGITDAAGGQQFQAAPAGDFVLTVDGAQQGAVEGLMCALDATEHIGFQPQVDGGYAGDRLRFIPYREAYVPVYPPKAASPVGPPVPNTVTLDSRYQTSWATTLPAPTTSGSLSYVAQPRGASLYGPDQVVAPGHADLIGPVDLAVNLADAGPEYPLAPYAGVSGQGDATAMTADQITGVEQSILAPLRRAALAKGSTGRAHSKLAAAGLVGATAAPPTTTTPAGLLVTLNSDASWQQVLLGQNTLPGGGARKLCFCNPGEALHQALQTNGLFLVAANAANLGAPAQGDGTCDTDAGFFNELNVDAWKLRADVGGNTPGDYRNIMIIKARQGALADLVAKPEAWTQAEDFAWPSDASGGGGNAQELPALSAWLQQYIADAIAQAGSGTADAVYFQDFKTLAQDPDWTGILVLRATIADLPAELAGITAGVSSPSRFEAHHFGVNISQVELQDGAPQVTGPSSIFGLIFYVDPALVEPPIPPKPGVDYAFRLLELKALFENTAVKRFESQAQLTLNTLLGMPVTKMGGAAANPFNTLVLSGSFQSAGGQAVYSLSTDADATFQFGSNIVNKIELTGAQMVTRSLGPPVVSAFGLTGFVDFAVVKREVTDGKTTTYTSFDILSFGSPDGSTDMLRQGLSFSALDLVMTAGTGGQDPTLVPDIGGIRFDVATSTPRDKSLFREFALTLEALVSGDKEHAPAAGGYLPVITDVALTGVDGSPWLGLRYELDMGSPGRLAGSVGLTSTLLMAWKPTSAGATYEALVGLELPGTAGGAELLSLENVLKLSIGQLSLTLDPGDPGDPPSKPARPGGFVLMMTEIALKFLGLLKIPPSGSTSFYLFGDPAPGAGPSGLGWYAQYDKEPPKQEALP